MSFEVSLIKTAINSAFHHKYLVACIDISILKHLLCGLLTGLENHGVRVGVLAQFSVQTVNAGCGPLAVGLFNPNGKAELVRQRLCVIHTLIKLFCWVYRIHPWVPAYNCISYILIPHNKVLKKEKIIVNTVTHKIMKEIGHI